MRARVREREREPPTCYVHISPNTCIPTVQHATLTMPFIGHRQKDKKKHIFSLRTEKTQNILESGQFVNQT